MAVGGKREVGCLEFGGEAQDCCWERFELADAFDAAARHVDAGEALGELFEGAGKGDLSLFGPFAEGGDGDGGEADLDGCAGEQALERGRDGEGGLAAIGEGEDAEGSAGTGPSGRAEGEDRAGCGADDFAEVGCCGRAAGIDDEQLGVGGDGGADGRGPGGLCLEAEGELCFGAGRGRKSSEGVGCLADGSNDILRAGWVGKVRGVEECGKAQRLAEGGGEGSSVGDRRGGIFVGEGGENCHGRIVAERMGAGNCRAAVRAGPAGRWPAGEGHAGRSYHLSHWLQRSTVEAMSHGPGGGLSPAMDPRGRVTRYRVERPRAGIVETSAGRFEATPFAERRQGARGLLLDVKDAVIGSSVSNARLGEQRLSNRIALAVFSSDALSSTAYATQEILFVLVLAGAAGMAYSLPIAAGIVTLLAVVVTSYWQTIRAYPHGGGAYTVARENLGTAPGLVAASALLIDYTMTVAVSVAAGVDALASLDAGLRPYAVELAVGFVAFIALMNLRGVRESGAVFAVPTYLFVAMMSAAIVTAAVRVTAEGGNVLAAGEPREPLVTVQGVTLFLLLRAFANGCTAMTGVEAMSNGVGAFREPAWRNAQKTLATMAFILGFMVLGLTLLARHFGFVPDENETIPSQLGAEAFGKGSVLFWVFQLSTTGILLIAANTAFADFPRLSAILAHDGFMPRIFTQRGNRLVFSWGILVLAGLAATMLAVTNATTTRLIPFYAFGVFASFTLSQAGMVVHWWRARGGRWRLSLGLNGTGAALTGVVTVVIAVAKFSQGGWLVLVAMPLLALMLFQVRRVYARLERQLHVPEDAVFDLHPRGSSGEPVLVPVQEINLATLMAVGAACERSNDVTAVHVVVDPERPTNLEERWRRQLPGVPLVVIDSPYRAVAEPFARYVDDRLREPPYRLTVLVPEVETRTWFERLLFNQRVRSIGRALRRRRHVTVQRFVFHPGGRGRRRWWRGGGRRGRFHGGR